MNKTERWYLNTVLAPRLAVGTVRFESLRLRLGYRLHYTPDFMVVDPKGRIELHEVKGPHWFEDARVKVKAAAAAYPEFVFVVAQVANRRIIKEEVFNERKAESGC